MNKHFKNLIISLSLCISTSIGLHAEQITPPKQELWDAMSADVDHWIDGAGYPVDQEIKDTVIVLNLLGIETTASCGGHLDRDLSYPWVDILIYPPEIHKMIQEFSDIQEQLQNEEMSLMAKFPNLSYNNLFDIPEGDNLKIIQEKHRHISDSIFKIQMTCLEPLSKLLAQFYENHTTSYDNILNVQKNYHARLRSIGAERQQIRSPEERRQSICEYREEMKAFTHFLKKKFMKD